MYTEKMKTKNKEYGDISVSRINGYSRMRFDSNSKVKMISKTKRRSNDKKIVEEELDLI